MRNPDTILYVFVYMAVPIILALLFLAIRTFWVRKKATAVAEGTIKDTESIVELDEDNRRHKTLYWIITFSTGSTSSTLRQQAILIKHENMRQYIGTTVTVHYDPKNPKRAWAETPDRHSR